MKKWIRRILQLAIFATVFAATLTAAAWWLSHRPPAWLARVKASEREIAAAAQRAERQMQQAMNWAQDQQALADSSRVGTPSTHPAQSYQITFTQDELNGFFHKWDAAFGWSQRLQEYASDPQLVVHEGKVILAATVQALDTIVSVEFEPRLEDGNLLIPVDRVMAGQLPLPSAVWIGYRTKIVTKAAQLLPEWQQHADLKSNGSANREAVLAGFTELLLNMLDNLPAQPVVFLPSSIDHGRCLAVKLTKIEIGDQSLALTVEPLLPTERVALLEAIRMARPLQNNASESAKY